MFQLRCSGGAEKIRSRGDVTSELPWSGGFEEVLPAFSVALHKGCGRVATLHLLLTMCIDDEIDLQQIAPNVWKSFRCLRFYNVEFSTLRDQTFNNFKLSCRGAIRKPPNVISWVVMLGRMTEAGDRDVGAILRQWNRDNVKAANVVGAKAQAVKSVLEVASPETKNILVAHVSEFGWEHAMLNEDGLASKKLFPGNHFRTVGSKTWSARQVVTKESSHIMFRGVLERFKKLPDLLRKKMSKQQLEVYVETASVLVAFAAEAVAAGLPDAVVQAEFVEKWVSGDPRISMDMSSAMLEKTDAFSIRDVPCIKELLDRAAGIGSAADVDITMQENAFKKQSAYLQQSEYKLLIQHVEYDCKLWRVYESKVGSCRSWVTTTTTTTNNNNNTTTQNKHYQDRCLQRWQIMRRPFTSRSKTTI